MNMGVSGLAVELAIKDRPLADRIAAVLQDLNIALVETGSDPVSIVLTDTLSETGTDQPTILLTDDIEVSAALRAGVTGVLSKSAGTTDLRIALEAAGQGLAIAPLSMLEDAHRECDDFEPFARATSIDFTPREKEVLALLAEGASNKDIARRLGISVHTAKFHVGSLLEKLDATGRTDAVQALLQREPRSLAIFTRCSRSTPPTCSLRLRAWATSRWRWFTNCRRSRTYAGGSQTRGRYPTRVRSATSRPSEKSLLSGEPLSLAMYAGCPSETFQPSRSTSCSPRSAAPQQASPLSDRLPDGPHSSRL